MTTDIERYQSHNDVDSWSDVMPEVVKLAEYISQTEFVPKPLRGRPAAVAAAILSGREMGIGPMRALSHVYMVDGRPSLSAEQKRAAALAAGHEIAYVETTTERCTVKGRRTGSQEWSTVTWTMDDARKAGLASRDNYRKHPRRMLQARATGELVDLLFPDASAGLATTEELEDGSDNVRIETNGHTQTTKGRKAKRRTAVQKPQSEPIETTADETPAVPQPPLPGEEGYDEPATTEPQQETLPTEAAHDGITDAQKRKIMALFNQIGIDDRQERLAVTSRTINRTIESTKDLNTADASALIDTLETALQQDDPYGWIAALMTQAEQLEKPF